MADSKITDLNELTTVADGDLLAIVDDPLGAAETKKISRGNLFANTAAFGLVPIGGVIAVFTGMAGCPAPSTTYGWALCNGTTAGSQGVASPTIAGTLPAINSGAFIRGATSSWASGAASGGADTYDISHTHTGPSHTHTGPSHTHTGPSHTHGAGTIKVHIGLVNAGIHYFYDTAGTQFEAIFSNETKTNGLEYCAGNIPGAATEIYNKVADNSGSTAADGTGATAAGGTGATGSGGTGATGSAGSATQSILPVYFSAVYYMRVK